MTAPNAPTKAAACPTCAGPLPPATFGRPPVYCGIACRREMSRLRRTLAGMEAQMVDARLHAEHEFWPGSAFWTEQAERAESDAAAIRLRIPATRGRGA